MKDFKTFGCGYVVVAPDFSSTTVLPEVIRSYEDIDKLDRQAYQGFRIFKTSYPYPVEVIVNEVVFMEPPKKVKKMGYVIKEFVGYI
jgi:hypothetical protein